ISKHSQFIQIIDRTIKVSENPRKKSRLFQWSRTVLLLPKLNIFEDFFNTYMIFSCDKSTKSCMDFAWNASAHDTLLRIKWHQHLYIPKENTFWSGGIK
ncbi:hypothetical protein, partial [Metabacillus malikii]|uniref:hypothetical protein n=1 Tax=Metabacillus malikii TaxID=1504265 RepID=UPI0027D82F09